MLGERHLCQACGMIEPDIPHAALRQAALAAGVAGPVPLIFANEAALYLLNNWLEHARRAGVGNIILVALDQAVATHPVGTGCVAVSVPFAGDFADLWLFRRRIFELLAAAGVDFIHADLDAVWLADPRPHCFAEPGLDMVFSQGLCFPLAVHAAWGFVLCCGLFAMRGNAACARFLAHVTARWQQDKDDQVAINMLLLESGTDWQRAQVPGSSMAFGPYKVLCYDRMLHGESKQLGIHVGLLPFHLVPRLVGASPEAIAVHPFSTRDPAERIHALKQCGAWLFQDTTMLLCEGSEI